MASKRIRKKHAKEWDTCPLCGKPLPRERAQRVTESSGRAVCMRCLRTAQRVADIPDVTAAVPGQKILAPAGIMARLDRRIIGQEGAKRAVATALWKQQLRAKGADLPGASLLLYGPTGCGKTALVREAAKIVDLPFLSFDATTLTEAGYRGRDAADMVVDLIRVAGSPYRARYGIIFLDEVDKLAAHPSNEYRADYNRGTQHSF